MFTLLTVAATAATCTPATTNDYFYTRPNTTNIFGRVMAETGDYRLVRQEDIAWINEAWAERMALVDGDAFTTNAVPPGALVAGGVGPGTIVTPQTTEYWTGAGALQTSAVTNVQTLGDRDWILGAASGWTMTNALREIGSPEWHKLVSLAAVTNVFAMIKGMTCAVKTTKPPATNTVDKISRIITKETGEPDYQSYSTNRVDARNWALSAWGFKQKSCTYRWDGSQWKKVDESEVETAEKIWQEGGGTLRLEFAVRNTNDWLRGASSPNVVRKATAWGVVGLQANWSEYSEKNTFTNGTWTTEILVDEIGSTNATVLVALGEARWAGAGADTIAYEVDVAPATLLATCLAATPWMPSAAEISGVSAPAPQGDAGQTSVWKSANGTMYTVYLVLDLKPLSWVDGW